MFHLPFLNFDFNQMRGLASSETFYFHYEKHHAGYIQKTNEFLNKDFKNLHGKSLEDICRVAEAPLADQARQAWNHTFYWDCLCSEIKAVQSSEVLEELVENSFGGFHDFKEKFVESALEVFGSGWLWVVLRESDQRLDLVKAQGADQPFWGNAKPILVCDVWEHAYYVDYRNDRRSYVDSFWNHIDWDFAETNIKSPTIYSATARMTKGEDKASGEWTTQQLPGKRLRSI